MKKMLSLFFSAVMFTSLIPATAFAEASDQAQITESSLAVQSGSEIIDSGTWGTCPWELTSDGTLTVHPGEGEGNFSTQLKSPWFRHTSRIERVIFTDVGLDKVIAPYHCDYLFANMSRLKTVDFSGLDASEGVDAYGMFTDCPLLKSIRWPAPGYLKIKNTGRRYSNRIDEYVNGGGHEAGMFEGCSSLVEVDWNAVDLSEMYFAGGMFAGCTSLEKVVFPEDKSPTGLMSASSMFENCSTLDSLDLSSFTVDRYPIVCSMFKGCSALKSVKLPSFLTGGPWQGTGVGPNSYVDHMFDGCTSLTEVDTSKLAVERVRDTDGMFRGCSSLVSIDLSSMGAVSQSRKYMFEGCTSLEHLKLCRMCPVPPNDGINMFYSIFEGCDNLTQIDGPCGFLTYTPTGYDCHHLSSTGLKRNAWVSATTGKRYTLGGILGTDAKDDEGTEFIAVPDDISAFNIKAATYHNYTYDGTAKNPGVWISPENGINFCLDEGVDYTLTYLDNPITAGSKRVLVEGIGWFTGAKQIEYVIEPTEICYIEMNTTEFIYDGMAKRPILTVEGPDKVLVEGVDYLVSWPSDVTNVGKKGIVVTGIGNYMGTYDTTYEIFAAPDELPDSNTPDAPDESSTPNDPGTTDPTPDYPGATDPEPVATEAMFRLYNPNSGEHFYSSSTVERDHLISLGWQDEGTGWIAPASGDAVYRLYNPYAGEHHYTLSAAERDMLVSVGWNDEGIGWYSDPNESVPLYRVYNPNEYANNHHYTTSAAERDMLLSIGWQDEGVSWHGVG